MAKKKCGICGKELGFLDGKYPVKDGVICDSCFEKGDFYEGAAQKNMRKFLDTQTAAEIKVLIDNPEKLETIKKKVAPKKHHLSPMTQCAFCGKDIYHGDSPLEFKNSVFICRDCMAKYKFNSARDPILWAANHTIDDFKKYLDQGKNFTDIELELRQQRQKIAESKEHQKQIKQAAKEKRKQEQAAIKAESVCYGMYYFNIKKRKVYFNSVFHGIEFYTDADKITSYRVNEKGHDENKHHTITRAAVGAIIAGTPGAIIAGTTGGKMKEYIDHLGLIVNLTDGSSFEVSFLNAKNNKADGFIVRHAYQDLNHVIAILDGWKAQELESTITPTDVPAEIRKYKQLMDDGILTKEEFEAKKKKLLDI